MAHVRRGPVGRAPGDASSIEPWTFRGGSDERAVTQRILTGLDGSAMPAYADALSGVEARALARYVRSLARPPVWEERDPGTRRHGRDRDRCA